MKGFTKTEKSFIFYDIGNSAYTLALTTALFPVYIGLIRKGSSMDLGYYSSLAHILIAVLSPVLGTIADYKDKKKKFFATFALLGILCTASLTLIPSSKWLMIMVVYILSTIGFAGANVFYDAFLVDITQPERMDLVSANGFAFGYIASIIPAGISLGIIYLIGTEEILGYRLGFLIAAIWWGLFTLPIIKHAKQRFYVEPVKNPIRSSFQRLYTTLKNIRQHKEIFTFLLAYFLYIDGVDTIIVMAVPYAKEVLGEANFDIFTLLGILLLIQIVAFPFALLYGRLAHRIGAKTMITAAIFTYILATLFAFMMTSIFHVFLLGVLVGSAQGGIQALSRSYYAQIIPKEHSNEFFGFYNIFGKFAAIMGPFLMALIADLTGVARYSILGILPLFILGLFIFLKMPKQNNEITIGGNYEL